jgi:brefeldin A-resistance guanine nucleotide exchange factor 1
LVQPETAVRVIKGEIHNVLCQFRGDQRYVSSSRFREEILEDKEQHHPVVQHFQDLHAALSEWEPEVSVSMSSAAMAQQHPLDPMMYLPVFCAAVTGREISAPVTGAALSALHKFLIYGFLVPDSFNAAAGMTEIANALLNCTFEESPADEAPNQRRTSKAMVAAGTSTAPTSSTRRRHDDEQVVLKLLEMSALVVRCSLQSINLIQADLVVGLLDTCLHVSHRASRASPLLKSAAVDSLSQIVLQVFAGTGEPVMQARRDILQQLAALLNPAMHNESVTVSSLTAVNIALETCREDLQPAEIEILQNDLCKYLLQWTTTDDQVILSLTLRVIFNLFQSIRNHLKVPLEVFFTSVHLRILDTSQVTAPPEQREIALESLLEFCQEPALMQDLYLNYDCDVACTNMYEHVVAALGKTAIPAGWAQPSQANKKGGGSNHGPASGSNNNINGGGGAKAVEAVATGGVLVPNANGSSSTAPVAVVSTESSLALANPNTAPVNALERLATEGILAVLDSIARRCQGGTGSYGSRMSSFDDIESMAYSEVKSEEEREWESQESDLEELHTRKQKKHSMFRLAQAFNAEPIKKEWRELAVAEKLLEKMDDPAEISNLLYTTPGLDKTQLGLYLSKGPDNKYPLEASVRSRFVEHFDFTGMTFAAALRKFLSKFRLPGEAQCIDRLMEAFSKELFQQQGESTFFKNADAVYVLSFSTIMLNTDLHNPTIKSENRMTLVQFIRNNRGINGGDDLPEDFLTELYGQIKDIQIQVRRELGECMKKHEHGDIRATWEEVLSKNEEVATPFFTPAARARRNMSRAGVHDKEMFLVLSSWALKSLPGIFKRSWDDALVVKALRGMQQMAKIAVFFELDSIVDDILKELLPLGRDYVVSCVTWDYANTDGGASVASTNNRTVESVETAEEDEHDPFDSDQPIPYDLLCTSESGENDIDIAGSATNRGLLALDCSFVLLRKYASRVTDSWPAFIECLCALRDARALPAGLSDLDDFADSNGNVLPLSSFAKTSQRKLDEYYRSQSDQDADKKKSWFRSFFDKKNAKALEEEDSMAEDDGSVAPNKGELSKYTRVLLAIAEAADVENVVQMGSTKLPTAEQTIRSLLATVDQYPYKKDPVMEQHAIFSLELAARALLSNRDRAPELFNLFLDKFESILGRVTDKKVPAPFVIERIVVTILRCSIHLYELPEVSLSL